MFRINLLCRNHFQNRKNQTERYLKNNSPGYDIYIISRGVHGSVNSFVIRPMVVPATTPTIVRIVNRFSLQNVFHFELAGIFQKGRDLNVGDFYGLMERK